MGTFDDEYTKLNSRQKQAVDTIDGPVLVVAGPGTGKTQLLSMRTANILQKTDADPQNILCLTFTNKAALNMRERLISLTDGGARDVMIKTFHSFASEVMNLYPDHFWNGARLSTAPDAVQNDIIQSTLGALPLDNPLALKFAGKFTAGNDVKNALRLTKEAGLTPNKLRSLIEANLAYIEIVEPILVDVLDKPLSFKRLADIQSAVKQLPEQGIDVSLAPLTSLTSIIQDSLDFAIQQDTELQRTTNTGKWKQGLIQSVNGNKGMHKERDRNNWWLALADVYDLYRKELHTRGYYDYSDMIVEVITVLEQNASLRADVQERFQYVLIDEFQDSNAAQMRLAHLVADHESNAGKPNLMAVGDDDQSIYKFNGAELANMLTFQKSYPDTKLIVLVENYRSSQEVLNTAELVIEKASDRLSLRDPSIQKKLQAKNPPKKPGRLEHATYANQAYQFHDIAQEIANTYRSGNHSIAVLARKNQSLRHLSSELVALDVPIAYQEQNNILDHQIVIFTHHVMSLILAIQQGNKTDTNYLLSQILRHPMWGIDPYNLWELATNNRRTSWLEAMKDTPKNHQLHTIYEWLLWLTTRASLEPLRVIVEYTTGLRPSEHLTSPLRAWYVNKTDITTDYIHGLSALRLLLSLTDEFARLPSGRLEDFVAFINVSIETDQIIADESAFVSGEEAIELLTIHKAKGLEFDTVYVIDAIDTDWRPRSVSRRSPANLPLQPAFDDMDDYIRLMYVAITRAKRSIIVTSFRQDEKGQDVIASPIISNLLSENIIEKPTTAVTVQTIESSISWPELSIDNERLVLKPRLENFQLSATALLDFLDITNGGPRYFKERHILSLPTAQTTHMAFGTAMHASLELAQILINGGQFDIQRVLERYQQNLAEQNLPASEFERFLKHGSDLLQKLFASETFWLPKGGLPEQSISDVTLGTARLYGKLDRVDINQNDLRIVDYKTGKPLSSLFTKDQTKAIKAWKHRTQISFYSLLAKHSSRFSKVHTVKGQLIYLEAANPKELIREFSPSIEELNKLEKLIAVVWNKIMQLDFPNTDIYPQTYDGIQQFESDLSAKLQLNSFQ